MAQPLHAVLFERARWKLPARIGYLTVSVNSLICPGRLRLVLKYFNRHSLHAAGLQGTRISGNRTEFASTLDLFDANSHRYPVLQWGYGSKFLEQVNKCTGDLDTRDYPVDRIVHRLTPPQRLQGRLGGVVIRRRSTNAQEDFHYKLIVAYAPLENSDSELLSLK